MITFEFEDELLKRRTRRVNLFYDRPIYLRNLQQRFPEGPELAVSQARPQSFMQAPTEKKQDKERERRERFSQNGVMQADVGLVN